MQNHAVRTLEQVSKTQVHLVRTTFERVSKSQMRAAVGIPIAVVTLVLTALALTAGNNPGFMEDYHILLLNTSTLGQNLIPTPTSGGSDPSPTSCGPLRGALGNFCAGATAAVGSAVSSGLAELSSIEDEIADKLAKEIGVQQWYSLHVMDVCQGNFAPNATTSGAEYNVTSCTQPLKTYIGPLHLNLAKLGFTKDLQDELDKIPGQFQTLAGFYILAVVFSGLSLLFCTAWLFRPTYGMSWANLIVAMLAAFVLFVGNIVVVKSGESASKINNLGQHIGLSVSTGQKFIAISWTAFVLTVVIAVFWGYETRQDMKARKVNRQAERSATRL
ncbi:actin cortical patch SUR7/pH-response regulator pali [Xylariaceae sp. FL1651]|nr:actin cortical patch SUR7/pH-response regulator pali [Xylariaceae sp. FL1651]